MYCTMSLKSCTDKFLALVTLSVNLFQLSTIDGKNEFVKALTVKKVAMLF